MDRIADGQLDEVKKVILSMGANVEKSLDLAVMGLIHHQSTSVEEVKEIENKVNQEHICVDQLCIQFLAQQGPVAKDLRTVVSIIKMNTDLERMGDLCLNIAFIGKELGGRAETPDLKELQTMCSLVKGMVKLSLDSFVQSNVQMAEQVLKNDDQVDQQKRDIRKRMLAKFEIGAHRADTTLDVILISRNLERIADHATNIAEDVIYLSTGKDVRHGGRYAVK